MPALLRALFIGFAWLPIAFLLYTIQSAEFSLSSELILSGAPAHALFIEFFTLASTVPMDSSEE